VDGSDTPLGQPSAEPRHGNRRLREYSPFRTPTGACIRRGTPADLDALCEFEGRAWSDRMSRRSLRRLLAPQSAEILVAQADVAIAGVAIVLFRVNSRIARLYSIAVAPEHTGRGLASALLAQAETVTRSRGCLSLRLEVHESNHGAIKVYGKAGYRQFGRHARYYEDGGDALRFEKTLVP
jgi:ribosomal protein S18 acetylase RimI-like enzyme